MSTEESANSAPVSCGSINVEDGPTVGVQIFESSDPPEHWTRLDELEGSGYRRTGTAVSAAKGDLMASIYVLAVE